MNINLNVPEKREAIKTYISLLYRFHKLSDREMEITVELILTYFEYLVVYGNEEAAFKLYTETESRIKISKRLGITDQVFRNYLTTLKKKNVLQDGMRINKVLIPDVKETTLNLNIYITYAQEQHTEGQDTGEVSKRDS